MSYKRFAFLFKSLWPKRRVAIPFAPLNNLAAKLHVCVGLIFVQAEESNLDDRIIHLSLQKVGGVLLSRFRSIIGAEGLNDSVRNGKRCFTFAMTAIDKNYQGSLGYQAAENSVKESIVAILVTVIGTMNPQGIIQQSRFTTLTMNSNNSSISTTQSIFVFGRKD